MYIISRLTPTVLENQWGQVLPVEDNFSHFQLSLGTEAIMIPEGAMQASKGGKHPVLFLAEIPVNYSNSSYGAIISRVRERHTNSGFILGN